MNRLLILALLSFLSIPVIAGEKAPLPAKLTAAKTAMLINEDASVKVFDALYDQFKKWNRFRLTENKDEADIVVLLSARQEVLAGLIPNYYLKISDAKDETPLWSDSCQEGLRVAYPAKKMVSTLRKRMDQK